MSEFYTPTDGKPSTGDASLLYQSGKIDHAVATSALAGDFLDRTEDLEVLSPTQPARANQLGLSDMDDSDLSAEQRELIKTAQKIEKERGGAGTNPNTPKVIRPNGQLCYDALQRVVINDQAWREATRQIKPIGW